MEFVQVFQSLMAGMAVFLIFVLSRMIFCFWVSPARTYRKLRRNGFGGPPPSFPLGNISEMKKKGNPVGSSLGSFNINHDIHSTVFPYFSRWSKSHGKLFIYWLGTESFLYIADPEFLKQISSGVLGKTWGKPDVFKYDRKPMFGKGLVMLEGDDWLRHRHVIAPAFNRDNLKAMANEMVGSTTKMLEHWSRSISSGEIEIDVEKDMINVAAEIIAKTSFGISYGSGSKVFEKLRAMQVTLFKTSRFVGVPFGKFMSLKETLEAARLGREIDQLLLEIISSRKASAGDQHQHDLLGLLLKENHVHGRLGKKLSAQELVDECKTFFFGGHETTALALSWTLLLLAMNPKWQNILREEIKEVIGDEPLDPSSLARLKKMGWVMNEVLRLYSPAPNVQRQAREDIRVGDMTIPTGTNMWIDVVSMHHDQALWGDDVNEFRPERFEEDPHGGCKNKMGYLPFGFGGRMCVGRNLTMMEYKIVLTLILTRFSFSVSKNYIHSPCIMLSLRPTHGMPLIIESL